MHTTLDTLALRAAKLYTTPAKVFSIRLK
jgi:hypothetical protein